MSLQTKRIVIFGMHRGNPVRACSPRILYPKQSPLILTIYLILNLKCNINFILRSHNESNFRQQKIVIK